MDAYAEIIKSQRLIEAARSRVIATNEPSDRPLLEGFDETQYWLQIAQLEMFGSPAVQLINNIVSRSAFEWFQLYEEWKLLVYAAETDPQAAKDADAKIVELTSANDTAETAGKRLVEAMLSEAEFRPAVRMKRGQERALKKHIIKK